MFNFIVLFPSHTRTAIAKMHEEKYSLHKFLSIFLLKNCIYKYKNKYKKLIKKKLSK